MEKTISQMSVEELIDETVRREQDLLKFYDEILPVVGYESMTVMAHLCEQQKERIGQLQGLLAEIHELRELTSAIAD